MKSILALLIGMLGASQSAQAAQPAQPDTRQLLKKWHAVPDLLVLARALAKDGDFYALQKDLEKEYRSGKKIFKITTNFRHQDKCSTQEHEFGAAEILLVNPKGESIKFTRTALHEIEAHGATFPAAIAVFLRNLPDPVPAPATGAATPSAAPSTASTPAAGHAELADPSGLKLVEFPGSLELEYDVKDAYGESGKKDPRWAVSKDLKFTPPNQAVLVDGPGGLSFRVQALLSNPTARAIKVYGWQVNATNPLRLAPIEDANFKTKPPDPNLPPIPPPVPLPPMGITIPPKTTVRFSAGVRLDDYDFKGGAPAKLEWSFHYWQATVAQGTLDVTLPKR